MRRTIVAQTHEEISRLRYLWEKVASQVPATIFQSFTWNYLAARVFADRETPYVIYAESDCGVALLPTAIGQAGAILTFMGEMLFDYRDVLSAGDGETLYSAWNHAAQLNLRFSAGAIRDDANFAPRTEFQVNRFYGAPRASTHEIRASDFMKRHSRLTRYHRSMEREGITLRCRTGAETDLVRFIYGQKGSQPPETGDSVFGDLRRVQFMIEIARMMGSACEIFTYESAGTLVAALVTFRDRAIRRFYTIYFDPRWGGYSPGGALINEVTKRSLAEGLDCDYMTGEHPYKMRFATSVVPMHWVDASSTALARIGEKSSALAA